MNKLERHEYIYRRDNYMCRICGKPVHNLRGQFAHLIGNTKLNKQLHGNKIIDHEENVVLTCSLKCNQKADISKNNNAVQHVKAAIKMRNAGTNRFYVKDYIDRMLREMRRNK